MPVTFSDNFDADAVGSTQTANWTNQGGTQPTVTAGSTLSAPNWYNSANFNIYRGTGGGITSTSGALQLSSYAGTNGTTYFAIVPTLAFNNVNLTKYLPEMNWATNTLYLIKSATTQSFLTV